MNAGKSSAGRGSAGSGKSNAGTELALRSGLTSGGLTAGVTIIWWIVLLCLRAAGGLPVFWQNMASLAWSMLVLGALATVINYVVGFTRGRIHFPGTGVNGQGRTAGGSVGAWRWLTAAFLALTAPIIVYVLVSFWLNSAMTIGLCLLFICVPAALAFVAVSRTTVR